jgi:hypothetical protein
MINANPLVVPNGLGSTDNANYLTFKIRQGLIIFLNKNIHKKK